MIAVPLSYGLALASVLFVVGLIGVEIMLNTAGLVFVVAGSRWRQPDGQVMFLFILTMAAVEVSVLLALIIQLHRHLKTLDSDSANRMRG